MSGVSGNMRVTSIWEGLGEGLKEAPLLLGLCKCLMYVHHIRSSPDLSGRRPKAFGAKQVDVNQRLREHSADLEELEGAEKVKW